MKKYCSQSKSWNCVFKMVCGGGNAPLLLLVRALRKAAIKSFVTAEYFVIHSVHVT